jgi:hypothetical protein
VKLTLPVIEITCFNSTENDLNPEIKSQLMTVVGQIIDKNLT